MGIYMVFSGADGESHIEELDLEHHAELTSFQDVADVILGRPLYHRIRESLPWFRIPRRV